MRVLYALLFFLQLFTGQLGFAQLHDTTTHYKDSFRGAVQQTVKKEVERWRDSTEAIRVKDYVLKHGKPLDAFLAEMKKKEEAKRRQTYIRIAFVTLVLIAVTVAFGRRKRKGM